MEKLEVGEKYLSILLFGGQIKLVAFKNKHKKNPNEPDFKSNDCAVWISTKKAPMERVVAGTNSTTRDNLDL